MGLFGLGSFGEGFVKGFATEANEALKRDIERINTRVEKVADLKVKRSLDEQEKRKKELKEIEEALREGKALFGDDPRGAQYAAALLKNRGSISSYKSMIAQLREQTDGSPINIADFFARAEKDAPIGTVSDYARAYQGAATSLPEYKFPESAATAGAGNLLESIGLKPDVSGRIQTMVNEQLAASGYTAEEVSTFSLPSLAFDAEGLNMATMTPSKRIEYIRQQMAQPDITDNRRTELQGDLNASIQAAKDTEDDETLLSALQMEIGYLTKPDDIANKQKEIQTVDRRIKLKAAIDPKEKLVLQSNFAAADGNAALATELARKAEDYGTSGPLLSTTLTRMQEDNMRNISDYRNTGGQKGYAADSEQAKEAQEKINSLKLTISNTEGAGQIDNATYRAAIATQSSAIKLAVENSELQQFYVLDPISRIPQHRPGLKEEEKIKATEGLKTLRTKVVKDLIATFPEGSQSQIAHMAAAKNLISAGVIYGDADTSAADDTIVTDTTVTDTTVTDTTVTDTTVTDAAAADADAVSKVVQPKPSIKNRRRFRPDRFPATDDDGNVNLLSAANLADDMIASGSTNTEAEIRENLRKNEYPQEYIDAVVTEVLASRKPLGAKPDIASIETDEVYKFITEESWGTSAGRKQQVIKEIAEDRNISLTDAAKLYAAAIAANKPAETEEETVTKTRNRRRRGKNALASGGLMSRN